MATPTTFKALYRSMLREGKKMMDFNFRNYAIRRTRLGFVEARDAAPATSEQRYQEGIDALKLLRRQSIISQLYHSSSPFVMDVVSHGK